MALHHDAINKDKHFFKGLQTEILEAKSAEDLAKKLSDFMKSPMHGDSAVFDTHFLINGNSFYVLINYSKFIKRRKGEDDNGEPRLKKDIPKK